jgi:hypothetical protein
MRTALASLVHTADNTQLVEQHGDRPECSGWPLNVPELLLSKSSSR